MIVFSQICDHYLRSEALQVDGALTNGACGKLVNHVQNSK